MSCGKVLACDDILLSPVRSVGIVLVTVFMCISTVQFLVTLQEPCELQKCMFTLEDAISIHAMYTNTNVSS